MSSMSSCIWQIALGAYRFCWLVRDTKHKKIGSLQNKGFTNVLFRLQNKSVLVIFNRTWNLLSVLSLCNLNPLKRKKKNLILGNHLLPSLIWLASWHLVPDWKLISHEHLTSLNHSVVTRDTSKVRPIFCYVMIFIFE